METKTGTILFMAGIFLLLAAVIILTADVIARKRSLKRMRSMIQSAMDGTFRADIYDESLCASVESKLAEYISASQVQEKKAIAEQEKTKTLIADISHQTKTPLANILLYAELLKEEAGEQYAAKAQKKGLYLHVLSEEAQGVKACFDLKWTLEALGNLIDNAIKYTETGGVTVSVKAYELFVSVEVADTGIGITEEEQAKVFGRFYRSITVSDSQGVGIGLYLAREIVRQQSGYLQLVSEIGNGSVFSLYLPAD